MKQFLDELRISYEHIERNTTPAYLGYRVKADFYFQEKKHSFEGIDNYDCDWMFCKNVLELKVNNDEVNSTVLLETLFNVIYGD